MKRRHSWIWVIAGGAPLVAAVYFCGAGGGGNPGLNSSVALAQVTEAAAGGSGAAADGQAARDDAAAAPAGGVDLTAGAITDFLRWQSLSYQEKQLQRELEASEWGKLMDFLKENCPNRALMLDRQKPGLGSPVRARLLLRWENIERLQSGQPDLYNTEIEQLKQEDVLIGLAARFRQARMRQDEPRVMDLRRQIQGEALKLVEMNLHERDLRLQTAQSLLATQQASLQRDEQNTEQLARIKARQFLQQVGPGRQFGNGGIRGGPPPSGTEDTQPTGPANSPTAAEVAPAPANPQH